MAVNVVSTAVGATKGTEARRDTAARETANLWLQLGLNNLSDYPTANLRLRLDQMRQVRMDAGANRAVAYVDAATRQFYYQFEGNDSGAAGYLAGPLPLLPTERQKAHLKQSVQTKLREVNLNASIIKQPPAGYLNWPSVVVSEPKAPVKQRAFFDPQNLKLFGRGQST